MALIRFFIVIKPDSSIRLCIDFKDLNAKTKDDGYQLPLAEDQLAVLAGSKALTTKLQPDIVKLDQEVRLRDALVFDLKSEIYELSKKRLASQHIGQTMQTQSPAGEPFQALPSTQQLLRPQQQQQPVKPAPVTHAGGQLTGVSYDETGNGADVYDWEQYDAVGLCFQSITSGGVFLRAERWGGRAFPSSVAENVLIIKTVTLPRDVCSKCNSIRKFVLCFR